MIDTLNRKQVECLLLVADRTEADLYTFVSNRTSATTIPGPTALKLEIMDLIYIEDRFLVGVLAVLTEKGAESAAALRSVMQRVA